MYCGTSGWQENDFIERCAGVGPLLDEAEFDDSRSSLPWYIWFGISVLGTASMILAYSWAPKDKVNTFCSKLFGVDPPEAKKKGHGKHGKHSKNKKKERDTSQNGEPDHDPMLSHSSTTSNPRTSSTEGHSRHSRRKSMSKGSKKKKKHRKSIRKSVVMNNAPLSSSGPKKSMLARQSMIRGDLPGSTRRKSMVHRKSMMAPGGRKSVLRPKLTNQMSRKEAKKADVIAKGTYTTVTSLAEAQKLKKQFEKNMQLYE